MVASKEPGVLAGGRGEKKSGRIRFATDGVDVALVAHLLLIIVGGWRADVERSGAGHHLVASNGRGAGHHQRRGPAWSRARDARRMASGSRTSNERKLRASSAAHRAAACGKRARDGVDSREDDGRHGRSMRWSRSEPPPAKPRSGVKRPPDIFSRNALAASYWSTTGEKTLRPFTPNLHLPSPSAAGPTSTSRLDL